MFAFPSPPPFVIYSFVLSVGTGQGDLDTTNGGKGKHWVWLKGIQGGGKRWADIEDHNRAAELLARERQSAIEKIQNRHRPTNSPVTKQFPPTAHVAALAAAPVVAPAVTRAVALASAAAPTAAPAVTPAFAPAIATTVTPALLLLLLLL